jgi:hypothetical protein
LSDCWKSGEDLFEIAVLGETTGNPADCQILTTWQARETNQVNPRQLPATLAINSLTGKQFTYTQDLTVSGGCDSSNCVILPPPYKGDGTESTPIVYWYNNGFTETGAAVRSTTGINLQALVNGNISTAFIGKIILTILGYVRRSTGELLSVGNSSKFVWQGNAIALPNDLEPGHAIAFAVSLQFKASELNIPLGSSLAINFTSESPQGFQIPSGTYPSNAILPEGQRLLIVPERGGSFRRLGGVGVIKGWRTPTLGEAIFTGLTPDTPNQRLAISGALGGDIRVLVAGEEPRSTEAIRAIVSTASGEAVPSSWSNEITLAVSGGIDISVGFPCTPDGRGTIRANYPDSIKENTVGIFNPPLLRVYVSVGNTIYRLRDAIAITPGTGQTFSINSLDGAEAIAGLPAIASNFCLFTYTSVAIAARSGSIPAGKIRVAVSYFYPPGNIEITGVTHDPVKGCIGEFTALTDAETLNNQQPDYYLKRENHTGVQAIATIALLEQTLNKIQQDINTLTTLKQDATAILQALVNVTTDGLIRKTGTAVSAEAVTPAGLNLLKATLAEQRTILGVAAASANATTLNGQGAAYYLSRANHTGSLTISVVDGLQAALDSKQPIASILTALTNAGNGLLSKSGSSLNSISLSSFGQGLIQSADAASARGALQLGSAAQQNSTVFEIAGAAANAVYQHEAAHLHATSANQIGGLLAASNLSDVADVTQARVALGLGTAALVNAEGFDPAGAATTAMQQHEVTHLHATSANQIGGLLAVNNLSDLTDASTARINLGVDPSQFAPISHVTTSGNGSHLPTGGITNTHVATGAAIAFAKLSGVCATPTSGTLATRPVAGATTNGRFYLATDQFGGTLYLGIAGAWVQCARGVTQ